MTNLTEKTSKELSIKKWEWITENAHKYSNADEIYEALIEALPELETLTNYCGYCELYNFICDNCPLPYCLGYNSIYRIWTNDPTTENSQKMLDLIIKS